MEAGREGRCFTYVDSRRLGVDLGDLVVVRLRGRRMHGLVMDRRISSPVDRGEDSGSETPPRHLEAIEALVQSAAVDPLWFGWIEAMAVHCHVSSFRMLKAALPPGWLGQRQSHKAEPRRLWWIQLEASAINPQKLPQRQADLQAALATGGGGAWQRDLQAAGFGSGLVNGLIKRGLIRREKRQPTDASNGLSCSDSCDQDLEVPQSLTVEQQEVVEAFQSQPLGTGMLLWGVTGSGKTEVYLQAIAAALEQGRGAIVLVPEISLTPQTVERFKARFSSGPLKTLVAVLHSHLSAGERHDEWHKIRQGRAKIVIGARSAIFAPVEPLGLIIVDEEHEHSYKQEESPRYHARDVAVVRGQREGATVVLGSATPSMESYHNAQRGRYQLLEMPSRADDKQMPLVRVQDMRTEKSKGDQGPPIFSQRLKEAIHNRLEQGEQTILFLNRRGFATSMQCPDCGFVAECPNCSLSLTYHRREQFLRCHVCGHGTAAPRRCPSERCGSPKIRFHGLGTEKVEDVLRKLFPRANVTRMDSDALKRKDDYRRILGDFRRGKIDILVGTQMIAKGLHFPRVTLVGIVYADTGLHLADFRAGERTW